MHNVHRLLMTRQALLIEKLGHDEIQLYLTPLTSILIRKVLTTNDDVDANLRCSFSDKNTSVILWYSSDRLQREQADRWTQIYQQLTSERQAGNTTH